MHTHTAQKQNASSSNGGNTKCQLPGLQVHQGCKMGWNDMTLAMGSLPNNPETKSNKVTWKVLVGHYNLIRPKIYQYIRSNFSWLHYLVWLVNYRCAYDQTTKQC